MDYQNFCRWANTSSAFMKHNGIVITDAADGFATASADLTSLSLNPYGAAHGGLLFTMADCATGVAAHTDGRHYVTLNSTLNFMRMAKEGTVTADAHVVKRGQTVCVVDVVVTCCEQELAAGTFTYFCLDSKNQE